MNAQEREQLTVFLQQLAQAQAVQKDEEALAMISSTVARQPDAAYLLVQRALILDAALKNAQSQMAQLQSQLEQSKTAPPAANFLDANAWGRAPTASVAAPMMSSPAMQPAPLAMPAAPVAPAAASAFQAPSFLTSMATTAAGVAAGAFLFQGVNHLLGSHGDTGMQNSAALHPAGEPTDSTVINNYFEAPAADSSGSSDSSSDFTSIADDTDASFDSASDSA